MHIKNNPKSLLIHQLKNFYIGDISEEDISLIDKYFYGVIKKLDFCFLHINNKYYIDDGETFFNPLHVAQWTMFLYTLAHELSKEKHVDICDKIYGISKCYSSADIFYEVDMPDIWFFDHPQGSVMGRAKYGNYFSFSQGCTVGNNKGIYPCIDNHVSMMSGSKILGNCHIGDHVILSANSYVLDQDIEPYSIVFGMSPNIVIKKISKDKFDELTFSIFRTNN